MNSLNFKQISKELLALALPMAVTQIITVSSGFIAMAMLGSLGHDVLAASALIFSSRISILVMGSSILFSLSILIGHAFGAKENERIGNFVQQGWALGFLLCTPIMFIFWNIHTILLHFGQSKALTDIIKQFFHANIFNVVPFFLSVCNQQLCYATRKQRIDLYANMLGVCVLLFSAYSLIFGHFGLPKLGVAGFGYALDLQGWTYFTFTTSVLYFNDFFKPFKLFNFRLHQNWQDVTRIFRIGWPICVQIGGEMFSFMVAASMVGWLGTQALAAFQVVTQYLFLVVVPLFGLSQASGVLVGQSFGSKNFQKVNGVGLAGVTFSVIISVSVALIFLAFPKQLASFYLDIHNPFNSETVSLIVLLFAIFSIQQIFDGVRNVLTGSLRGLFDTQYPMRIGLMVIWLIGIPLGYLLAFHASMGVAGLCTGSTIGIFLGMLLIIRRWQQMMRKLSAES